MKKCMAILLCLVIVACVLVGCGGTPVSEDVETGDRFVIVVNQGTNIVYADTETGVMYFYHNGYQQGGLTVMVDADGNPLIWDGFDGGK